jgi:hypothetical protein
MDPRTKILFALTQVNNISNLMEGNQWEGFFASHLLPMKYELERQLGCLDKTPSPCYASPVVSNEE